MVIGSLILNAAGAPKGEDVTRPADYEAEREEPGVEPLPATPEQERQPAGTP